MTTSHTICIYEGTRLKQEVTRTEFKYAWRAALRMVRAMAHADGCRTSPQIAAPKGRASYDMGNFRALPARYVRTLRGLPLA